MFTHAPLFAVPTRSSRASIGNWPNLTSGFIGNWPDPMTKSSLTARS
ncbi:hypothetical protein [Arthrobacter sp. NPDC093139]